MNISIAHTISVEDYFRLRRSVDFDITSEERAKIAIKNTLYLVVAMHEGVPIGMSRVVGDGGYVYFICDVIVHPDYQSLGIGRQMIENVLGWIESSVSEGETIMVNLMSALDKEPFYECLGFHRRPFDNHGCGMSKWIRG